jgi:hypothetical protein
MEEYCLVVVGNKADLVSAPWALQFSEEAALDFRRTGPADRISNL